MHARRLDVSACASENVCELSAADRLVILVTACSILLSSPRPPSHASTVPLFSLPGPFFSSHLRQRPLVQRVHTLQQRPRVGHQQHRGSVGGLEPRRRRLNPPVERLHEHLGGGRERMQRKHNTTRAQCRGVREREGGEQDRAHNPPPLSLSPSLPPTLPPSLPLSPSLSLTIETILSHL